MEHFRNMDSLNEFIRLFKNRYDAEINIISVSSTQDGYDLFYEQI